MKSGTCTVCCETGAVYLADSGGMVIIGYCMECDVRKAHAAMGR